MRRAQRRGDRVHRGDGSSSAASPTSRHGPRRRLGNLADLGLREQRQVAADLAERPAQHGDLAAERRPVVALDMPSPRAGPRSSWQRAARTAAPLSPSDASVPTAPPNCSRKTLPPAREPSRSLARASGATQATILKPKLITVPLHQRSRESSASPGGRARAPPACGKAREIGVDQGRAPAASQSPSPCR